MRMLLAILILFFGSQFLTKADDIREFEIEGISIGDSLLDYFKKEEIKSFYKNATYYRDDIFAVIFVKKKSKNYDRIQVTLKPSDDASLVYSVEGIIDFDKKINECKQKKKSIINDLKDLSLNYERVDDDRVYAPDQTNNSFSYSTWLFINSGGYISVSCTKMGKEVRESKGWTDELSVSVTSKEMEKFLRGNPY